MIDFSLEISQPKSLRFPSPNDVSLVKLKTDESWLVFCRSFSVSDLPIYISNLWIFSL